MASTLTVAPNFIRDNPKSHDLVVACVLPIGGYLTF